MSRARRRDGSVNDARLRLRRETRGERVCEVGDGLAGLVEIGGRECRAAADRVEHADESVMRHARLEVTHGLGRDRVACPSSSSVSLGPLRLLVEVAERRRARGQDAESDRAAAGTDRRAAVTLDQRGEPLVEPCREDVLTPTIWWTSACASSCRTIASPCRSGRSAD